MALSSEAFLSALGPLANVDTLIRSNLSEPIALTHANVPDAKKEDVLCNIAAPRHRRGRRAVAALE